MENFARGVSTQLCFAAEEGNLSEVKKCLRKGANVLERNTHHTVLHSAVRSDNEEIIKLILDKIKETQGTVRPYIDAKDTEDETPLMWTAKCKFVNAARILLKYGANTEAKNRTGMTALHWAAKNNHIEVMKLLISKGANTNVEDINGLTPLEFAREERRKEIAAYLAFSLSEMFRKQGKYNEAWQAYEEALDKQELALGPIHPDVLMTRHNMAVVLANQSKHSEALEIYQKVFDIQKRRDVLGPDHPDTLMTRYNMAVSFSALGDSNEVFSIFRELLNIKGDQSHSDHPIPLTKSDKNVIQKDKLSVRIKSSKERYNKLESYLDTENYQEDQESEEEIFEQNLDKLEALKRSAIDHLEDRGMDVFLVPAEDEGRPAWHYLIINQGTKEKFLEQSKKCLIDLEDYGTNLFCGLGENPPQNVKDKIRDFFMNKVSNDLFVIKEECKNVNVYHYLLVDQDKKKLLLEQFSTGISLVRKTENCGIVLYSGLGQDPPEIISDTIVETYFNTINGKLKEISAKLNIESTDNNGWTTLHDAAYVGNVLVVKNLIDGDANLLVKDTVSGRTPLHIAAREGHTNVVELFLNKGMNVNEVDLKNWTPLHYAAWNGHLRAVTVLIHNGADIHSKEMTCGKKPIHIAAKRGYTSIVNLLLRYGESIDGTDKEGRTSLFYAALGGHVEIVKNLADRGADIHAENIYGTKPLHVAALSGSKNVLQFLLDRGANMNDSDKKNCTPLHFAAYHGYLEIIKFLIKKGANINERSDDDKTPSDFAKIRGHKDIVDLLDGLK